MPRPGQWRGDVQGVIECLHELRPLCTRSVVINENQAVKLRPAVYGEFLEFPFRAEVAGWLDDKIQAVKAANGIFMLTLQPGSGVDGADGLKAVTP